MQTRPAHHKQTRLKHPSSRSGPANAEQHWLRRFWVVLSLISILSISLVIYGKYGSGAEVDEDAYINVQTVTSAADDVNVVCKLSLLIDPEQEERLKKRQHELEIVVRSVLAEAYQGNVRPTLAEVRQQMLEAFNKKLPRKLQIRDVYIQQLLVGTS